MSAITLLLIGQSLYNKINIQTSVLPFSTWVRSLGWKIPWRRERLPTPVLWPGESYRLYSPWGHKDLDMTE